MLVLSRKIGEEIQIGDNISLKVLDVSGSRVRLGVTCPDGVRILRSELLTESPLCESTMHDLSIKQDRSFAPDRSFVLNNPQRPDRRSPAYAHA